MSHFNPATAQGIIDYLEWRDFDFEGMNAVVIGRSDIVGKPVAKLLLEKDCNVTICHSKTPHKNLMNYVYDADLIICAVGKEKFLDCKFVGCKFFNSSQRRILIENCNFLIILIKFELFL